jgi:alpha-beta hydrolase superfamily lysophospholipase
MDFVGHGLSSGTRGHFKSFDCLVNDFLNLLIQMKKDSNKNEKWIVLGHGMGGLVALDLLNRFQFAFENCIDGLILSNFILNFSSPFLQLEEKLGNNYLGFKKNIAHLRPHYLYKGKDILTSPEAVLTFEQDPLIIARPTLNTIREIQNKLTNIYQDSYFLEKPIMLLKSKEGGTFQGGAIDYFAKGIKKGILTEKNYSHLKHDLYNEIENISVFKDIMEWMKIYEN